MPVSPLSHMARRACVKNMNSIHDVGDAQYAVVRPLLLKIQNPKQLWDIEQASPQICGPDAEIWRDFIKRDIPNWDKKPHEPSNAKSWYKVYLKLRRDSQKEVDQDAKLLKATLDGIKNTQAKNTAQQVELNVVKVPEGLKKNLPLIKLPRNSKFFDKERNTKDLRPEILEMEREMKREIKLAEDEKRPERVANPSTGKTTNTSKGKLAQFRKEALAMSHFPRKDRPGVMSTRAIRSKPQPTTNKVTVAPRSLVEAYRSPPVSKPFDPSVTPAAVFNPKKRRIEHVDAGESEISTIEQREKRLKAFTNPSSTASRPSTTSSSSQPPPKPSFPPPPQSVNPHDSESLQQASPTPRTTATASSPPTLRAGTDITRRYTVPRLTPPSGARPIMRLKNKAPANVFMPIKRQKLF